MSSAAIIWEGSWQGAPELWRANRVLARGWCCKEMLMAISGISHSHGTGGKTPSAKPAELRCKQAASNRCHQPAARALGCHWVLQASYLLADPPGNKSFKPGGSCGHRRPVRWWMGRRTSLRGRKSKRCLWCITRFLGGNSVHEPNEPHLNHRPTPSASHPSRPCSVVHAIGSCPSAAHPRNAPGQHSWGS